MGELREPTESEREQDIKFLNHILFEIRDYARSTRYAASARNALLRGKAYG